MSNIAFQVNCMMLDAIMVLKSPRSDAIVQAYAEDLELSLLELEDMDNPTVIAPALHQHLKNEGIRHA